ncbi:MAG TPA: DUF6599 family protein [Candidatus Sulfotelmatobacter sp.]|nr:DUF6599 family protein [Candidatus Sulfotelmatobacter sp.]
MRTGSTCRGALFIALIGALFLDNGCSRQARTTAQLFPASNEVAGWAELGNARYFEGADLWKYIDGEAERYLKSGVQRVHTADYKFQNTVEATVDIYVMGNAEGATKVFDSAPAGDARPVQLGDAARLYSQSLAFHEGPYLVRIVAFQESPEVPQALLALGRNIEQRLKN